MRPEFRPGRNIAMKVPAHEFEPTVSFYRDVLGLAEISHEDSVPDSNIAFAFGDKVLWIDRVMTLSQAEVWFEVLTDDLALASERFLASDCPRCDAIEPLPKGFEGFWISSPANVIHLVTKDED